MRRASDISQEIRRLLEEAAETECATEWVNLVEEAFNRFIADRLNPAFRVRMGDAPKFRLDVGGMWAGTVLQSYVDRDFLRVGYDGDDQ